MTGAQNMTTRAINVEAIHHGLDNRKRKFNPAAVAPLADSIRANGLHQPIVVREIEPGTFKLLAGRHRLEACRSLGWATVPATIKPSVGDPDLDGLQDELTEVDENLIRQELGAVDNAMHVRDRKRIFTASEHRRRVLEAEAQAAKEKADTGKVSEKTRVLVKHRKSVAARQTSADKLPGTRKVQGFTADTAKASGVSERAVRQEVQRGDVLAEIAGKAGVDVQSLSGAALDQASELDKLAELHKLKPDAAVKLVKRVATEEPARKLAKPSKALAEAKQELVAEARARGRTGTAEELENKDLAALASKASHAIRAFQHMCTRFNRGELAETASKSANEWLARAESLRSGTAVTSKKHLPVQLGRSKEETAQREQAKKDQARNAKKSLRKLQPKSKPANTQMEDTP